MMVLSVVCNMRKCIISLIRLANPNEKGIIVCHV